MRAKRSSAHALRISVSEECKQKEATATCLLAGLERAALLRLARSLR
jgi:hypothetical protein